MKPHVLIVDDERALALSLKTALSRSGYRCSVSHDGTRALALFDKDPADVVITDRKMPKMNGMQLMARLHERKPRLPVIFITAYADISSAVQAMRDGAFDYLAKPFDNDELRALVARALELSRLTRENQYLRQELIGQYTPDRIIAESDASQAVLSLVKRVAPSTASVLIEGESGTGKELIARLLHYWSERVGQPFIAVNCKAFAAGLLESELFGHEQGAFTGAHRARAGCFERAHGGTLFLDEIGETDDGFQAKLLRVLQEAEVLRVGGNTPRAVDVRIVAATNKTLADEVRAGDFRQDLYFRLNVIPIRLAPLRERTDDILPLATAFLNRQRPGMQLGRDARARLIAHGWPGNVRELENAIERGALLARGDVIEPEDLLLEDFGPSPDAASAAVSTGTLQEVMDRAAALRIRGALEAAGGHRGKAAEALGVDRSTLYRLSRRLGITD